MNHHMTSEGMVPFTPAEEAAYAARQQTAAAEAVKQAARDEIAALEAKQTARRVREAVLGADGGWMAGVDAQIAALRKKLVA